MKAKVIAQTTVNNAPAEIGAVVEVDKNTFENLARKGRLEAVSSDPEPESKSDHKPKPKK